MRLCAAALRARAPALLSRRRPPRSGVRATRACAASAADTPPPPPAPLAAGEVHLWWLDTRTPPEPRLLDAYRLLLSADELAAVDSAGATADVRTERLLSRALAQVTLARYARTPPAALRFGRNAHGKPWLAADAGGTSAPALRFSVAHAPGALLCAVALNAHVGCDVEAAARGSAASASRLARRYFTAAEAAALEALPPGEPRRQHFLQLWTLKEAYVKALGRGIAAAPLDSFGLKLSQPAAAGAPLRVALTHGDEPHDVAPHAAGAGVAAAPAGWRLALLALGSGRSGHVAAVCAAAARTDAPPLVLRCWRTLPLAWDAPAQAHELTLLGAGGDHGEVA